MDFYDSLAAGSASFFGSSSVAATAGAGLSPSALSPFVTFSASLGDSFSSFLSPSDPSA